MQPSRLQEEQSEVEPRDDQRSNRTDGTLESGDSLFDVSGLCQGDGQVVESQCVIRLKLYGGSIRRNSLIGLPELM